MYLDKDVYFVVSELYKKKYTNKYWILVLGKKCTYVNNLSWNASKNKMD